MKEEIESAVKYAKSSNGLENNHLSDQEAEAIINNILTGRTEKTFLYSVIESLKEVKQEKREKEKKITK